MQNGIQFGLGLNVLINFLSVYVQYSPILSQSANDKYIIYYYSLLSQLSSDKTELLSSGVIPLLLLIFKILYRKIGECCALCITKCLWYHILESYCLNTFYVSWSMLCTFDIFTCIYCLYMKYCFDTNVYNAFIMKPRDFRNPNADSCCNLWFKFCQLGSYCL